MNQPICKIDMTPLVGVALILVIVVNAAVWPFFYVIVNRAGAFLFSLMNIIALAGAIVWGVVLFAERHSPLAWTAMGLMLLGFFLIVAAPRAGAAANG